jgi:hypothetical protein
MKRALLLPFVICGVCILSEGAFAQAQETVQLSQSLYFDCAVAPDAGTKPVELDASYFVYADRPQPQVNFYDPTRLITDGTGWASAGHFALSRLTADGQLFVWLGQNAKNAQPQIDAVVELKPTNPDNEHAAIYVTRFEDAQGAISTRTFEGTCDTLSGKAAWDSFQQARTK